jgi:hypothetical protein
MRNLKQKLERTYPDIPSEDDFGEHEGNHEHPRSGYLLSGSRI